MPDQDYIRLSERMHRLPPYLFGELNKRMLRMRRAGADGEGVVCLALIENNQRLNQGVCQIKGAISPP